MKLFHWLAISTFFLGLCSTVAQTAPAPATSSFPPYFVGEVVVNEDALEGPESSSSIQEIEADEIEALGATTVAEAVAHLPGVSLSIGSRNEQRIWLGGYDPANVLVLLDGVPIADPYAGEVDLGQVPVADVAKIVVATGGAASLYGPNALGGVINIVTVQGAGDGAVSASLRLTEGSTMLAHAAAGGSAGSMDWYLGLAHESSDGWDLSADFEATNFQPAGTRVNSDISRWSLLGRIGTRFAGGSRLSATLRFIDSEKGIPFHTERPRGFVRFARFPEWRQGTLALGWEGNLGSHSSLRAQLYGHRFDNALDVYSGPELDERDLRSTFEDRVLGGYAVVDTVWGKHGLSASLHLREDRHHRLETTASDEDLSTEKYSARSGSLAFDDEITLNSAMSLILGASLDLNQVTEIWQLAGETPDTSSESVVSPHLELRAQLSQRSSGSVSLYRRTRFPTLLQLYGSDVPNPLLEPQQSSGVNATFSWRPSDAGELRLRVYFDQVEKLISRLGRGFPYENQDEAELAGLELAAIGRWKRLDLRLAACAQRADFTASAGELSEVPYVPEATFEAGAGIDLGRGFATRVDWSWVGERVWYDFDTPQTLDAYHLLRLSAAYGFGRLDLRLELENLLDENIEQEWGYPLPGRRLWLVATSRF